jgi:PAS domain S-box-containing protein
MPVPGWACWAIGVDMTERKNIEDAYRRLILQSLEGVVVVQRRGIVLANPALCDLAGRSVDEVVALSLDDIKHMVHPDDSEVVWQRFEDRLAGKAPPSRYELRVVVGDGTIRWLEIESSRITHGGEPAVQVICKDITDRKRLEDEIERKSEELERIDRLCVGRELRMIELKREVNEMAERAGLPPPYDISLLDDDVEPLPV